MEKGQDTFKLYFYFRDLRLSVVWNIFLNQHKQPCSYPEKAFEEHHGIIFGKSLFAGLPCVSAQWVRSAEAATSRRHNALYQVHAFATSSRENKVRLFQSRWSRLLRSIFFLAPGSLSFQVCANFASSKRLRGKLLLLLSFILCLCNCLFVKFIIQSLKI